MKVLAIHNFHRSGSASGDDQVFRAETKLLEDHGVEVVQYTAKNDEFDEAGAIRKILTAFGMLWSFRHYKAVQKMIEEEQPDLVHVHTFFPLLSPSILYAAKRKGCKVVATLHDTRFVCPCATSLRGTELCNACGDGHYFRMCRYGCFKNSRSKSFITAFIFSYHRRRRTFYDQIDRYICLNENQRVLLEEIGFDPHKITKKYNFIPDQDRQTVACEMPELPERYAVFYGRIGEEKGIRTLMKIWDEIDDIPLVVMGGGPLEEEFRSWAEQHANVYFLGYTERSKCLSIVKRGEFVVFPSIWYEGCSMVEIEAESLGVGLVATNLGFSAEAIENGYNGYKVPLGDVPAFVRTIRALWEDPKLCKTLGANARQEFRHKYLPEDNYQQLIAIYEDVLGVK